MITKAVPNLTYTSINVIPLSFFTSAINLAGLVLIIIGIMGLIWYWLNWLYVETEEENI
jgi:D-alanyl-lipoteichoic acid acyltransferase DltB (MBOAT superfamily)